MDRRELLKASLMTCGVAVASRAFGSSLAPNQLADGAAPKEAIVRTSLGRLRGAYVNGVYSFKGVHYGASTAGSMRFLPPSTPMPWTGVRNALELGPLPPQSTEWPAKYAEIHRFLGDTLGPEQMSEDCLVLNLWTPSLQRSNKRPVMVWLHGGACSSGIPLFDGTHLAGRHDVVVVGLNHRLSFFGHLYLGGIGGEKYADSGNLGLLDIVLALQWVRTNIAHFGGDPHNVTIFGESNGGGEVSVLMAMPSAKDLFQKAIVESGSDLRVRSREEADATARKFLAQLHVAQDRVDDLQAIPMDRFIAAVHSMGESFFDAADLRPVLDGRSLPRQPFDPDAPAISADVPMLIGTNADEMRTFFGLTDPALFSLNEADMRTKLKAYGGFADDSKLDELIALYKKNRLNPTPSDIFFAIVTKAWFRMDAITQAERKAAQRAAPVYMYIFEWQSPVRGGKLKAFHGAELPFVFDNVDKAPGLIGEGAGLQPLADKVSSTWVEFARSGNPDHTGLPHWPPYEVDTRATMIFNDDCKVMNDPDKDERLAMARLRT